MLCLLIHSHEPRPGPAWHRVVRDPADPRFMVQIALPGQRFENPWFMRLDRGSGCWESEPTSARVPVRWATPDAVAAALADAAWEGESADPVDYLREVLAEMVGTPDDFPGLDELHPEMREQYAAALAALDKRDRCRWHALAAAG